MLNDEENAGEGSPLVRRLQINPNAIVTSRYDPKQLVKHRVNDVANMLQVVVDAVRENPSVITAEEATKIHAFLAGQVEAAGDTIARLVSHDPGVAARFDFDMMIAAPQAPRERHPFTGAATPHLASRLPSTAVSGDDAVPVGRLIGTNGREKVYGEPEPPPPARATPSKNTPDGDVDDDGDGSGTGFLDS